MCYRRKGDSIRARDVEGELDREESCGVSDRVEGIKEEKGRMGRGRGDH